VQLWKGGRSPGLSNAEVSRPRSSLSVGRTLRGDGVGELGKNLGMSSSGGRTMVILIYMLALPRIKMTPSKMKRADLFYQRSIKMWHAIARSLLTSRNGSPCLGMEITDRLLTILVHEQASASLKRKGDHDGIHNME